MASTGDSRDIENAEETRELDPGAARTSAEYVALLRRLKEHSGLTFRQLEQKAAERGDILARSTLADVLRRDALPRAEIVTALVRACGVPKNDEPAWLEARERIASASDDGGDASDEERESSRSVEPRFGSGDSRDSRTGGTSRTGRTSRTAAVAAVASLGTVALLVIGVVVLLPQGGDTSSTGGADAKASKSSGASMNPAATPLGPGPAPGLSRIRPARAPELCLTDGDVRAAGGESKLVAVQRPCAEAVPPRTYLLRADNGLYRIQWDNPEFGKGCLTLLNDGDFRHMLEPWDDCEVGGSSQLFRIERVEGTDGWRLRPAQGDEVCVGIRGAAEEEGAAAVAEGCEELVTTGGDDSGRQLFLIGRG
ncbi:helix-turn-helix domain-containing protein [Streptomyces ipomoeae]|uniref:helix-turn-helix domain-containing protein n=1 Tax=Streptomyces ipomoeae TaxID=103232 RepID=UPI0007C54EC7|nr:helix-turn-helix transcriptional regulator [Streptomyces ipomoeae]MDX2692527.1 helix-turn-helix transcriptional regulator [Streptomyces ipomoeae]MDX2838217.1 helix-turn-helix transcriptional regulator [Streptomyces ipomoeae]